MKIHRTSLLIAAALAVFAVAIHFAVAAPPYEPTIDPANFSADVTNPYFTLTPGTTYTYKSQDDGGTEVNKVTVTEKTRKVMGVTTWIVWDRVWPNDKLIEETYDWYAQDKEGNVWYFPRWLRVPARLMSARRLRMQGFCSAFSPGITASSGKGRTRARLIPVR